MKKQLLIAAVAATLGTSAMADISITGDAHMRYANTENGAAADTNSLDQRIRLKTVGTSGDTKVVMGLRTDNDDDQTSRATGGTSATTGSATTGLEVDYRFLTTKVGPVNVKVGDWWETTGLGLVRKGQKANSNTTGSAYNLSTTVANVDLSVQGTTGAGSTTVGAATEIAGWKIGVEHDNTNLTGYTDVTVQGTIGPVSIAAEKYDSDAEDNKADAGLVHVFGKVGGVTLHAAYAEWENDANGRRDNNSKFSPLGVSVLGSANGVNGNLALGNVNATDGQDEDDHYHISFAELRWDSVSSRNVSLRSKAKQKQWCVFGPQNFCVPRTTFKLVAVTCPFQYK
jgi:hypothetical protein